MNYRWVNIFLWIIVFQIIGASLGILTQSNIHSWYDSLAKSSLTPPAILFSIVWPVLYVTLAISGYLLWQDRQNPKIKAALYSFIMQMLMNWAWTPIFFHYHAINLALLCLLTIIILVVFLVYNLFKTNKIISLLLTPYLLWLLFAFYLNLYIVMCH